MTLSNGPDTATEVSHAEYRKTINLLKNEVQHWKGTVEKVSKETQVRVDNCNRDLELCNL